MDLVSGVRKEGSRGGRGDFKWTDVQASQHRENYLGHSVMAPVGRWQRGRDLQWYAKGTDAPSEEGIQSEKAERQAEIRRIQQVEEEAMSNALGFRVDNSNRDENASKAEKPAGHSVSTKARSSFTSPSSSEDRSRKQRHKRHDYSSDRFRDGKGRERYRLQEALGRSEVHQRTYSKSHSSEHRRREDRYRRRPRPLSDDLHPNRSLRTRRRSRSPGR